MYPRIASQLSHPKRDLREQPCLHLEVPLVGEIRCSQGRVGCYIVLEKYNERRGTGVRVGESISIMGMDVSSV